MEGESSTPLLASCFMPSHTSSHNAPPASSFALLPLRFTPFILSALGIHGCGAYTSNTSVRCSGTTKMASICSLAPTGFSSASPPLFVSTPSASLGRASCFSRSVISLRPTVECESADQKFWGGPRVSADVLPVS